MVYKSVDGGPEPESALLAAASELPFFETERALADWACAELEQWFSIEREVVGVSCGGAALRVDAVLRPRDPTGWKDAAPAFAVEFKIAGLTEASFDTRRFTSWAAQTVDYTHVDWRGYGRLPLFVCPGLLTHLGVYGDRATSLTARLLWQLGVGELMPINPYGWALIAAGSHKLWTQHHGVRQARTWSLAVRSGSR